MGNHFKRVPLWLLWTSSLAALLALELCDFSVRFKVSRFMSHIKPVGCEPLDENDGALVHIDCPILAMHSFNIPKSFKPNLPNGFRGIFFEVQLEMFQDTIPIPGVPSKYTGIWSDHMITASSDRWWPWKGPEDIRKKPLFFPNIEGSGRHFGPQLVGGSFIIDPPHTAFFRSKRRLPLVDDNIYTPSPDIPPTKVSSRNTRVHENALYTGDPLNPKVGDLRISFFGSTATHVTAIGMQSSQTQKPFARLSGVINPFTGGGAPKTMVMEGDYTIKGVLHELERTHNPYSTFVPIARQIFFVASMPLFYSLNGVPDKSSGGWRNVVYAASSASAIILMIASGVDCTDRLMYSMVEMILGSICTGIAVMLRRSHATYALLPVNDVELGIASDAPLVDASYNELNSNLG